MFETACEEAEAQLKHALNELEQSWIKGYLLGQEKKIVQDLLRDGLTQVQVVHQTASRLLSQPTHSNGQSLQQALSKLTKVSTTATQPPDTQAAETALSTASIGWITRIWDEVQYFLAPVIITGWGILVKFGVLAAGITQNLPLIGGLICTLITTQQRIAVRIAQLKTENTVEAAQAATNAAQEATKTNEAIQRLEEENAQLKEIIVKQNEKIATQDKKLDQILILLTNSGNTPQPLTHPPTDPASMSASQPKLICKP